MSMYSMVFTTTATLGEARKIARGLVKARLIACANVLGPVESHFTWKGKTRAEKEYLVLMKTKEGNFLAIKRFILKNHSYEVPELVLLPIKKGLEKYLRWMDEVIR